MRYTRFTYLLVFLSVGCRDAANSDAPRAAPSKVAEDDSARANEDTLKSPSISQQPSLREWIPQGSPAPEAVRKEAKQDATEGRYEMALSKFIWLLRHDAIADQAKQGTQMSPFLSDWKQLGDAYPPAKAMLMEIRKEAESHVRDDVDAVTSFNTFAAINVALNDEQATVALFKKIDKENVQIAGEAFEAAWPALIKHGELELCSTYVDPKDYYHFVETYQQLTNPTQNTSNMTDAEYAKSQFSNRVISLVALLVLSDRKNEAEILVRDAVIVLPEKEFSDQLGEAMDGKVPRTDLSR